MGSIEVIEYTGPSGRATSNEVVSTSITSEQEEQFKLWQKAGYSLACELVFSQGVEASAVVYVQNDYRGIDVLVKIVHSGWRSPSIAEMCTKAFQEWLNEYTVEKLDKLSESLLEEEDENEGTSDTGDEEDKSASP